MSSGSWLRSLAVLAVLVAAGGTSAAAAPPEASPPIASAAVKVARHASKVLVVIEENHSLREMSAGMPYLSQLSRKYGYATRWHAVRHPSEPNYLAIAGGSTFGVANDAAPAANQSKVGSARSVFGQALARHKSARTYAESMAGTCDLQDGPGTVSEPGAYAVRHNPWTYFAAERTSCRAHDTSAASFVSDARRNALPTVGFLIPDLVHDAHDSTLARADQWLRSKLPAVLASTDFKSGRLVVVLTSVLAARLHHKVVRRRLTHYSLTRYIDSIIGAPPLRHAKGAPNLRKAFGL